MHILDTHRPQTLARASRDASGDNFLSSPGLDTAAESTIARDRSLGEAEDDDEDRRHESHQREGQAWRSSADGESVEAE
jgi:hypothetical protein